MSKTYTNPETIGLHAGWRKDDSTNSVAVPIHQTSSFQFDDCDHAANLFALSELGNIYSRIMNPTCAVLEDRIAELQGNEVKFRKSEAEKRLRSRHPDFDDIRNSDDFHSWAKEQPQSIQDWIYSNADDADLASRALDLFKKDLAIEVPTASKSNSPSVSSAADMVSTKTTTVEPKQERIWTEKEINALSMDEFDKYEDEISEAMQQGRIIKD